MRRRGGVVMSEVGQRWRLNQMGWKELVEAGMRQRARQQPATLARMVAPVTPTLLDSNKPSPWNSARTSEKKSRPNGSDRFHFVPNSVALLGTGRALHPRSPHHRSKQCFVETAEAERSCGTAWNGTCLPSSIDIAHRSICFIARLRTQRLIANYARQCVLRT